MPLDHHEPREQLPPPVLDHHRALESLIEELEAVTWYHERAAATGDGTLKAVLIHNRNEEIEHAMMNLEWLRRNFPEFDTQMKTYLFTTAAVTEVEAAGSGGGEAGGPAADGSLNIGSMTTGG